MSEEKSEKEQEVLTTIEEAKIKESEIDENAGIKTAEAVKDVVIKAIQSEFSGPIPPPNIIKGYEEILPGAADRIIRMAETQACHRQAMEKKMVDSESRDSLLGIFFAFSLGIGCLIAAVVMVIFVPQNAGAISAAVLGVTGIGSITSSFIRSIKGTNERNQKKHNER